MKVLIIFIPHQTFAIIVVIKSKKMRWAGGVDTWEWEQKSIQSLLKAEGKMLLVRRWHRLEYNIKPDFRGVEQGVVDRIHLAENTDKWLDEKLSASHELRSVDLVRKYSFDVWVPRIAYQIQLHWNIEPV